MPEMNNRAEYWESVRSYAEGILEELEIKTLEDFAAREDSGEISDRVWETVDNSQWIIYYSYNMTVLDASDNPDAFDDAGIELDVSKGWRHILTQVAFFAMEHDIRAQIESLKDDLPETVDESGELEVSEQT